jgi:hypothetical protein
MAFQISNSWIAADGMSVSVAIVTGNFLHEHRYPTPQLGVLDSRECSDQP